MSTSLEPLIRKLENFAPLDECDKEVIGSAVAGFETFGPHAAISSEGDPVGPARVVLSGFACRHKVLPNGRRQIIGYLVPGDLCDVRGLLLRRMDHTICALAHTAVGTLSREAALGITERHPHIAHALWWSTMLEESIAREWLISIGQRSALERLAHLLCEIFVRLQAVGLADGNRCEFPVTQVELADTLALSAVHVNRTLRELRAAELITIGSKSLEVHDFRALQQIAMFDPHYLHLNRPLGRDLRETSGEPTPLNVASVPASTRLS